MNIGRAMIKAAEQVKARFHCESADIREINGQTVFPEGPQMVFYVGPTGADVNDESQWMKFYA